MTAPSQVTDPITNDSDDDGLMHWVCPDHDPDFAFCGTDVSRDLSPEEEAVSVICVVCQDLWEHPTWLPSCCR